MKVEASSMPLALVEILLPDRRMSCLSASSGSVDGALEWTEFRENLSLRCNQIFQSYQGAGGRLPRIHGR